MAANNFSTGAHLSGSRRLGASLRQVGLTGQRVTLVSPTIHDVIGIYHPPISKLRLFHADHAKVMIAKDSSWYSPWLGFAWNSKVERSSSY
jgi:hypothetical protein